MSEPTKPRVELLFPDRVDAVIEEAYEILEQIGIAVELPHAVELLAAAGARVSGDGSRVFIPRELTRRCIGTAPARFSLFGRAGEGSLEVGGDATFFDPGSSALSLYDHETGRIREASTSDVVRFTILTDRIDAYAIQSTGLIPADLPEHLADRFRLLISLVYGHKPVITGTFVREGFATMYEMLSTVRGGADNLRARPLAVFDCCPTAPLTWSELTCDALVACARTGIPAELVSMPLTGASSPVTLAGAIVQHTAETLSGIVIHQLAGPGSPVVYGGAPSCFDMRKATTPMGSVETMMIDASYARVGRRIGLPVHAYMGLSDSKCVDYQAGFETAMGLVIAALAGVNIVSGPGMLNFVGTQSLEKLVLDGEVCAMAQRLLRGVRFGDGPEALDVLRAHAGDRSFLTSDHTRKHFRSEVYFPSIVVDRGSQGEWEAAGRTDASARAHASVEKILADPVADAPEERLVDELEAILLADARAAGLDGLPDWKFLLP